jgi:gliding motility-associated-like protein
MKHSHSFTVLLFVFSLVFTFANPPVRKVKLAPPVITNSALATGMNYIINKGPSNILSFTVSGTGLSGPISVIAPTNYEIALDQNPFQSTPITLNPIGGAVNTTTIYVRLRAGLPVEVYNEKITLSSTGATSTNLVCFGAVSPKILSVTGGGNYCTGASVKLDCDVDGDVQYFWSGPNSFTSNLKNPTISGGSGWYKVAAYKTSGTELIQNPDFEQGNVGFTSTYKYANSSSILSETILYGGNYTVSNDPGHPWGCDLSTYFASCGDHTTGTGKMLCVNGGRVADVEIWGTDVTVIPNMNYTLTYWVQSFHKDIDPHPSRLQFKINGKVVGGEYKASKDTCIWRLFQQRAASSTPNVHLSLVNMETEPIGNDFAMDDVSLKMTMSDTDSVYVNFGPIPAPTVGTIKRPDCTTPTGSVVLKNLPKGNWSLKRNPGNIVTSGSKDTTTVSGLAPGTYLFTVTDANGGCTSSSLSVTILTKLNPVITPSSNSLSGFSYKVTNGPSAVQSFTINGTELSADITVTPPVDFEISTSATGPFQSTPLTISKSGTNVSAVPIYVRLKAGLGVNTYKNENIVLSSKCATDVNVSCSGQVTPLIQTISAGDPYCPGATINLSCTVLGATTYSWIGPNGYTSNVQNPSISNAASNMSGTYTVTATAMSSDGLTALTDARSILLTVYPVVYPPKIKGISQPTCGVPTGSVKLYDLPTGNWKLQCTPAWSWARTRPDIFPIIFIQGTKDTCTVTGLQASTDYTFTVTDMSTGCSSVPSVTAHINDTLVVPAQPQIDSIVQPFCGYDFASVKLKKLPKGNWRLKCSPSDVIIPDGSGEATTVSNLLAGKSYTFIVTDASSGCVSVQSSVAIINPSLNVPVANIDSVIHPTCGVKTGGVVFKGLPASWKITPTPADVPEQSGTNSSFTFEGLKAKGTYTFVVTDLNSRCVSTPSAPQTIKDTLRIPPPPKVKVTTIPTCIDSVGSVLVYGLPSTGNWTLKQVMNGTSAADKGFIRSGSGDSISISKLVGGTYRFYVIDEVSKCPSLPSDSSLIVIPPQPVTKVPTIKIDQPTCAVATGTLKFTGLPSNAWIMNGSDGNVYKGTDTTFTIQNVNPGKYTFWVKNQVTTCDSKVSDIVEVLPQPITPEVPKIENVVKPTCNKPYSTIALSNLPPTPSWTLTATPSVGSNVLTLQGKGPTTEFTKFEPSNSYSITVFNGACNSEPVAVTIAAMPPMPAAPVIDSVIQPTCAMPSGSVKVSGLPAGNWVLLDNQSKLQAKDAGIKFEFMDVPIGRHTVSVIDSYPLNTIALISKSGTDNAQHVERNERLQPIIYHTFGATGVTVTNLPPGVNYEFRNDSVIISGASDKYDVYDYQVYLNGGCGSVSTSGTFTILPPEVIIPNAFSPNGDGDNDLFKIKHSTIQTLHFKVFDRSGLLVYDVENFSGDWDGKSSKTNQDLASGTYYYMLEVFNGVYTKQYAGYITMLR